MTHWSAKTKTGYTFIEMLVVLSILGIVMIATVALFLGAGKVQVKNKTIANLKQTGNFALETIERKVHNASLLIQVIDDRIVTITDKNSTASTLTCNTDENNPDDNGLWLDNTRLIDPGATLTLESCTLTVADDSRSLSVEFTLENNGVSEDFSSTIGLREY